MIMRKFVGINFIVAVILFILILGFEIGKHSPIRILYFVYIGVSWALPGIIYRNTYKVSSEVQKRQTDVIISSICVTIALIVAYHVLCGLFNCQFLVQTLGSVVILLIGSFILLIRFCRITKTNKSSDNIK